MKYHIFGTCNVNINVKILIFGKAKARSHINEYFMIAEHMVCAHNNIHDVNSNRKPLSGELVHALTYLSS